MKAPLEDSADYVIVGSGAGGATAAHVLSEAGASVIVLEEGPALGQTERALGLLDAMDQSMRDLATIATASTTPIPLLMGRCVGGSTAINSGIIWRIPEDVRLDWSARLGLSELVEAKALEQCFSRIEHDLGVLSVREEVLGGNAQRLRAGSQALDLPGQAMRRNAKRCVGSARCLQGCPTGARQSMENSYIPAALRRGARLHALARARRVLFEAGRAVAVTGNTLDPQTRKPLGTFCVHARRGVIVSAGAVFSPVLLWNSGLRRGVGEGFQVHPGAAVVGQFNDSIGMGYGATQSYEIPLRERGFKIESLALPPELLAARLPGAGASWQAQLQRLDHFGQFCAVHRSEARGRVHVGRLGGIRIDYELTAADLDRVKTSLALLVRLMFAAGANEVYPGVARLPERMTRPEQADLITAANVRRRDVHLLASHHFGTAAAGGDERRSVVDQNLACHAAPNLYVMDASALPTNLGVNPQHTIMAVTYRAAERLANRDHPARHAA
jgi:choline dehydrogenase-like flavoprotein